MSRFVFNVLAATVLAGIAGAASAQYAGPGARTGAPSTVALTVAEVLRKPVDDQHVQLTGQLIRQTGRETFLFRDATGEIQVEIDREDFPQAQPVSADTRVILDGEVDTRLLRAPEIDVERLQIAPAA